MWWPGLDKETELAAKSCAVCQNVRRLPPEMPSCIPGDGHRDSLFQRVHKDFCHTGKDHFLVLVDTFQVVYTVDVKHMTSTTTERTIDELRLIFAEHGLPEQLISDNGPQLTSEKFARFMRQKGNMHTLVPSYHPASSGAAERSVRVVREALEKHVLQGIGRMTKKHRLANFLIKYRSTPHNRELKHRRF